MSDRRYRDFDALLAEREKRPIEFKVGGEVYSLPPDIPAGMVLSVLRLQQQYGGEIDVPITETTKLLEMLLGPEQYDRLLGHVSLDMLQEILGWITAIYAGVDDADSGNPTAPENGARASTSSKTGGSSKRTSRGSTTSTSRVRSSN